MLDSFSYRAKRLPTSSDFAGNPIGVLSNSSMGKRRSSGAARGDVPAGAVRQKRHGSGTCNSNNSQYVKRRLGNHQDHLFPQYLDNNSIPSTPSKTQAMSRGQSVTKWPTDRTPRTSASYVGGNPASPCCCSLTGSSHQEETPSKAVYDNRQRLAGSRATIQQPCQYLASSQANNSAYVDVSQTGFGNSQANPPREAESSEAFGNENDEGKNHGEEDSKDNDNETRTEHNGSGSDSNSNNNNNNNEEDDPNKGNVPSVAVLNKKSSQALVQKLQDIYKIIVKQEIELQERCSQLTNSQTTELKQLWAIYRVNSDLINNYIAFITSALLPSQSDQDLVIGQEIVEIYRIERRLWVYGTITFLDVLKNFSNFMDPEVCAQFITHAFISISNMLADIPARYAIPWYQRLGDLSRMAIALYPSSFIDWKLSAEYWYTEAMKYTYGHGKLYYHMSTVQQNTLEAFVNLGKSVFCQDTFIPSQQYMQLVIDNIYQRAFVERNNGNHRNALLIEYLKHSEVMLLPSFLQSADLHPVVLLYFREKFGLDTNEKNIFDTRRMFCQDQDQLTYFFRHAPAFAESHILQLIGFGDPKNPFALLFDLPKNLKERKDKKEKRRVKSSAVSESSSTMAIDEDEGETFLQEMSEQDFFDNLDSLRSCQLFPPSLDIWIYSLKYLNKTSMNCSMIVLRKFLEGPIVVALPHLLPWAYFIIAVALRVERISDSASREFWTEFINRIFPWNTIVNFLNVLMAYMLDNAHNMIPISPIFKSPRTDLEQLVEHFNENEDLPEVWKCWGTLWFDVICNKDRPQVDSYENVGIKDHMFLDAPIDGIGFDKEDERAEKFWKRAFRIIHLFKGISQRFNFRIVTSSSAQVYCRHQELSANFLKSFCFKLNDARSSETDFSALHNAIERMEESSYSNADMTATPPLSVIENESIFDYPGYRKPAFDYSSYDRSGDLVSSSIYTSNGCEEKQETRNEDKTGPPTQALSERKLFEQSVQQSVTAGEFKLDFTSFRMNQRDTHFVLDATTWLRHFAHVYKLASNDVLQFAICLTTFQELRFLRKSKDENVVEAATRAVITVRQLYAEGRILPLRFTGNVATHIEEHLEFEEQITWRSHVDEFVFEAVRKAQERLSPTQPHDTSNLQQVVLVTDDANMRAKAQDHGITTFTTKFVFAITNAIGYNNKICTN
ncbi:hypothetical protein HG536_0H02170 [Torulaspora globosa]|uniref:PIN domain-containing protein n=1 Tax=Torulaspora globosa TaxID=48254 RepID=A0A7G3ZMV6_9SACH|nr:uncharacterized protein HG536_0H02170 [Torulaspora globosa]QLL34842.1 hypothetical protein HG536_0H02170 [Torulaspora globosa]